MRLKFGIAFNLALIACLSSFLLGLGSSTHYSTILVFFAAISSLYLTDLTHTVRLNRFVSNALIIVIVFFSLGSIFRYRSEDIAIGIARLLQLIQIVVLFQEKNSRNRWHILMISFLQVVVATAFQQSLSFGLLLLVYVFANLTALTLIYLHDENDYFKKHSFVRGAFQLQSAELRERQNIPRLLKIAFATFIIGPLSLLLFYRENELEEKPQRKLRSSRPQDAKFQLAKHNLIASRKDAKSFLGTMFAALFSGGSGNASQVSEQKAGTGSPSESGLHWEVSGQSVSPTADLWEDVESEESSDRLRAISFLPPKQYYSEHIQEREELARSKWPLIHLSPIFSGGTNRQTGVIGRQSELYMRLAWATLISLVIGAIVFLIIPRFNELEIFGQRLSHDRWRSGTVNTVSSVGFSEEIRLGSLGNVLQNYQEVLSISFSVPGDADFYPQQGGWQDRRTEANAYKAIVGNDFYLRGVVVDQYQSNQWSQKAKLAPANPWTTPTRFYQPPPDDQWPPSRPPHHQPPPPRPSHSRPGFPPPPAEPHDFHPDDPWSDLFSSSFFDSDHPPQPRDRQIYGRVELQPPLPPPGNSARPWWFFPMNDRSQVYFDTNNDLVQLKIVTQPLDTKVLFTVWPFYILESDTSRVSVSQDRVEIPDIRRLRRPRPYPQSYFTTAFRNGIQVELIPCTETITDERYLQISREKLPKLCELAQKWDRESRLDPSDVLARARNLSDRLRNDARFQYQLGGIVRDYSIDPLEDFIANNPKGHCEFFAGALAMMLRSVNIPSRVCIGYKAVAENQGAEGFMVRQSDAHSWVEAYIAPESLPAYHTQGETANAWTKGGWLRLDATPDPGENLFRSFSISLTDLNNFVQSFWRNYVMNMDGAKQTELVYGPIRSSFEFIKSSIQTGLWKSFLASLLQKYSKMFQGIREGTFDLTDFILIVIPVLIITAFVYFWFRLGIFQWIHRLFGKRDRKKRSLQASIEFYLQLEKLFSKIPVQRNASETQREFVQRGVPKLIESLWNTEKSEDSYHSPEFLQQCADNIVDAFYRIRFGNEVLSEKEIDRIASDLQLLKIAVDRI